VPVLSEFSPRLKPSASARDLEKSTLAAEMAGWKVFYIPQDLPEGIQYEDVFWNIPRYDRPTTTVWVGYIPLASDYRALYKAALEKNLKLINSPEQYCLAEEFHRFYPLIQDLTPRSIVLDSTADCDAISGLTFPVFVKGTVQSLKASGLESCLVNNQLELKAVVERVFEHSRKSLGKAIVREFVALRHCRKSGSGFPIGREFRVFLFQGKVLSLAYYWEGEDAYSSLNEEEESEVRRLAEKTAARLSVPWISVDIGQKESGEWIVIECGDAQFSGLSQNNPHQLWHSLAEAVRGDNRWLTDSV